MVEPLDLPLFERDQVDLGAGVLDGLQRFRQLDLLDHVGGKKRNSLPCQISHLVTPLHRIPPVSTLDQLKEIPRLQAAVGKALCRHRK
jgi:hypothetical protein